MKEKLGKILNSIYKGMGEWACVDITYCPEWVAPLKEAAELVEEAMGDFNTVKENVRKEIEGKFIDGAIKHAEHCADNEPFEVGRRKHRGKMYQVFITVKEATETKDEMPKMACPKCGKLYDDFDGLSFVNCPACGYCSHPNSTVENGKEICGICGQEIIRR